MDAEQIRAARTALLSMLRHAGAWVDTDYSTGGDCTAWLAYATGDRAKGRHVLITNGDALAPWQYALWQSVERAPVSDWSGEHVLISSHADDVTDDDDAVRLPSSAPLADIVASVTRMLAPHLPTEPTDRTE